MENKTIKIVFDNGLDVDYHLHDSKLAEMWAKKIKHLQNIPIDSIESYMEDVSDIKRIYNEFCKFADIEPINTDTLDQDKLNQLHQSYEDHHDRLALLKDNAILYKLHHSIHFHEREQTDSHIKIGWGKYEGPLTEQFSCYNFYEDNIIKNYIYLPWSELGKRPVGYWKDKEPNNQDRFNTLAKPHTTIRAKFFIATEDVSPMPFDPKFVEWFDQYRQGWLARHGIDDWKNIHEDSAPLLATTNYKGDLSGFKFKKIILQ
jgi:hypothetical protein|tara:strand:- start:132 stop:911 length:780 start_codon:yes stop_codon:yes gene_type:complete